MTVATHTQDTSPVVSIPNLGSVRGVLNNDTHNKVTKFLNVPFAVVEERWRPATKVQPWDGIRDATKLGYVQCFLILPLCPLALNLVVGKTPEFLFLS